METEILMENDVKTTSIFLAKNCNTLLTRRGVISVSYVHIDATSPQRPEATICLEKRF